jgi:hypothetical protein
VPQTSFESTPMYVCCTCVISGTLDLAEFFNELDDLQDDEHLF